MAGVLPGYPGEYGGGIGGGSALAGAAFAVGGTGYGSGGGESRPGWCKAGAGLRRRSSGRRAERLTGAAAWDPACSFNERLCFLRAARVTFGAADELTCDEPALGLSNSFSSGSAFSGVGWPEGLTSIRGEGASAGAAGSGG